MTATGDRRLRVSMLVRNSFQHDSRVEKEARTLVDVGYEVTVVAERAAGLPARETRDGYEVVRVSRPLRRLPFLRFFAYRNRFVRALLGTRPDILHAHDTNALEPVAWVARRLRIPFVYDGHELWLGQTRRGRPLMYWWAFLAYYRYIESRFLKRAAAWVTVSPPIARHLEQVSRLPRVEVVANYPELRGDGTRREIRELPGGEAIPTAAPIVLYLGALMPGRGLHELITAIRDVPEAHLVMLGRGGEEVALRRRIAELGIGDRVHIIEPVPPDQVVEYARSATIGVSPGLPVSLSYEYSLPNKLFECMAAGLPVVASDFEQVRDVVVATGAGVTVDTRHPAEIARALREILDDPATASRMGRNAATAAAERFNWAAAADVLRSVYGRVVDGIEPAADPRRLLVVTRIWPTPARPASGIFVSNRFRGVRGVRVVVARPQRHWILGTLRFIVDGLLVRGRFDGVEAHVLYPAGLVGLIVSRLRRIPLLAYAHGTDVRSVAIRGPLYRFLVRLVLRHADLVVTNSSATAEVIHGLGREAEVIPPGYDPELFHPSPRPAIGRRRVLYLGGADPNKGIEVARELADWLAGPGIRELDADEVARLMAEHDVVLMPSHAEGLGMVAIEAIASGRWVVARAVGGLREVILDGVNGSLVDDSDFDGALATIPDYDPTALAGTVERFRLERWQASMAAAWTRLLGSRRVAR